MRRPIVSCLVVCALGTLSSPTLGSIWPNSVERVQAQLKSEDVAQRRRAAKRLSELPEAVVRRLALAALDDPDADVKLAAQASLRDVGERRASSRVITWLSDPEPRLRVAAAELLAWSPHEPAVFALSRALGDPDPSVRLAAAKALGASGRAEAVLPLLGHLDDDTPMVRREIVFALSRIGDVRAVVPLIGKIQDTRPEVRRAVALALGELGDTRSISALILALRDTDDTVRVAAIDALGRLGDAQALMPIATAADEADVRSPVRLAGLEALARLGTPEALDRLIAALGRDGSEATPALEALSVAGAVAVPRLVECLRGRPPPALADGCARGLARVGDAKSAPAVRDALKRGAVGPIAALEALGSLGDKSMLPTVLEHLESRDRNTRLAATSAVHQLLDPKLPDGRAVEPLERAFHRARAARPEQIALLGVLGRTGAPRAARLLVPLAEDSDDVGIRVAALEALGRTGGAGADRAFLGALEADEAAVRMAAAIAAWRKASGATARPLLDRLLHAAEQDRVALALALGGALARSKGDTDLVRVVALLGASRGGERDQYLEAIARHPSKRALKELAAISARVDVADRAKVAEVLSGRSDGRAILRTLASDVDGSVRANAFWSLGVTGDATDQKLLSAALTDRDPVAAANAAVALGRLSSAAGKSVAQKALCGALSDARSVVRANALTGLRVAGARCSGNPELVLLEHDRHELVREATARLLIAVPGPKPALEAKRLARCGADDVSSRVAVACTAAKPKLISDTEALGVFVVPRGEAVPVPRAAFAMRFADGTTRLGRTDRRGYVVELAAPKGEVSLDVPASER